MLVALHFSNYIMARQRGSPYGRRWAEILESGPSEVIVSAV